MSRFVITPRVLSSKVALGLLVTFIASCQSFSARVPADKYVDPKPNKPLTYGQNARGDRIPDFSNAGYMGGGVRIPNVAVQATVEPGEGDDGARIQEAIDRVSQMPLNDHGFRGAVLLKRGEYQINNRIIIAADGIVLRGEGDGPDGTTLIATGTARRTLIVISGDKDPAADEGEYDDIIDDRVERPRTHVRSPRPHEVHGTRHAIKDPYVPVGARRFRIDDAGGLAVGDPIIVYRPSTAEWIHELGMDRIPERKDGTLVVQWKSGSRDLLFDRIITAINGDEISIDAPLCNSLDQKFGGGYIYKYEFPERISHVGIENLRGVSEYAGPTDEEHSWTFIRLGVVQNAWVRRVTAEHFAYSLVLVDRPAKWITIEDCANLDPASKIEGSRRYSYALVGQLTLVQRCTARNGRHDFVLKEGEVCGPNVFLDCRADRAIASSGPHGRWCTGTLFDNVQVAGNDLDVTDLGNSGTGHGWAGAAMVFWNCSANRITCDNPPTAQNWAIGCKTDHREGDGDWASFGKTAEPQSLYRAQLAERLGLQAVVNIARRNHDR